MASAYAKTLRQMINDTLRICGDYQGDGKDGRTWMWTEVQSAVKDAVFNLVRATGVLKDTAVIPLIDGVAVYDLPPNCIRILRVGIHGLSGKAVLPRSMAEYDRREQNLAAGGYPYEFFRDVLAPDQIGVFPTPDRNGSTSTRDSDYGLLRRLTDADGNELPFDSGRPLRRIAGVPFTRSGSGNIIREVISPYGNLMLNFVRTPSFPTDPDQYIDSEIPEYVHPLLKYGAASILLPMQTTRISALKIKKFFFKWKQTQTRLMDRSSSKGPNDDMRPA